MVTPLQPPELKYRVQTLAEKLFKRAEQQPEKQAVGFVFLDLENTRQGAQIGAKLFLVFLGAIMLLWGAFFIYRMIQETRVNIVNIFDDPTPLILIVSSLVSFLLVLVGVQLMLKGIGSIRAESVKLQALKRAEPGELVLPCYPLRLGETLTLTFRRHLKAGYQAQTQGWLWGRLICLEVYMDDRGSGSASFYGEPVWWQDLPALEVALGVTRIEQDWYIRIPADGIPTIRIKGSNESQNVLWGIDVWLDIPGLIKDDSVFCLRVEPEIV